MFQRLFGAFAPMPGSERVHVIDAAEVRGWLEGGEAVLVDVREANEYVAEHIPGARNLPLSGFDPARLPAQDGRKLVIHCQSGQRCGMAAMRLVAAQHAGEIYRMKGGIIGWKSIGGATRSGPQP